MRIYIRAAILWLALFSPALAQSILPASGQINLATGVTGNLPNVNLTPLSANSILGALTATTPSGLALPSCSASGSALEWTSGTGFSCASLATSGANSNITSLTNLTTPLLVAQGGTGTTTSTGTGSVVLSAAPTFTGTINAAGMSSTGQYFGTNFQPSGGSPPARGMYLFGGSGVGFSSGSSSFAGDIDPNQHWRIGGNSTPTIASGACGTGTNGTIAINGNDQAFEVLIGSAAATSCVITFASAFTSTPRAAELTNADSAAAAVTTTQDYVSGLTTTTLTITGAALANADYYVIVF